MERSHLATSAAIPPFPDGPIVIPLDNPSFTHSALHIAAIFARKLGKCRILLRATDSPCWAPATLAALGVSPEELDGVALESVVGEAPNVIPRLLRQLHSGLVVLGLPSVKPGRQDLGPVREKIMALATCPVVLVPEHIPESWGRNGRVLLPLDGTPSTSAVVPFAFAAAEALEAGLDIVHVACNPPEEPGSMGLPVFLDHPEHGWDAWRTEFIERNCACELERKQPTLFIRTGRPSKAILDLAEVRSPDLIVLGWHGRLEAKRAVIVREVIAQSRWPILLQRI